MLKLPNSLFKISPVRKHHKRTSLQTKLCKVLETFNYMGWKVQACSPALFYCLLGTIQSKEKLFFFDLDIFFKYTSTRSHTLKQQKHKILS